MYISKKLSYIFTAHYGDLSEIRTFSNMAFDFSLNKFSLFKRVNFLKIYRWIERWFFYRFILFSLDSYLVLQRSFSKIASSLAFNGYKNDSIFNSKIQFSSRFRISFVWNFCTGNCDRSLPPNIISLLNGWSRIEIWPCKR